MSIFELKDKFVALGKNFENHKIYFHKTIVKPYIAGLIYNEKLSEVITLLESDPRIKNKKDLCIELLRNFALKKARVTENYEENLKIALQASLLYYFDFASYEPILAISKIYQEEIGRGNHLVVYVDTKEVEDPLIMLAALVFAEKIKAFINASPYRIKKNRERIINILKQLKCIEITSKLNLIDLAYIIIEKFSIYFADLVEKDEYLPLIIVIRSLIEDFNKTLEIIKIIDEDEWLSNIIKEHQYIFIELSYADKMEKINVYKRNITSEAINLPSETSGNVFSLKLKDDKYIEGNGSLILGVEDTGANRMQAFDAILPEEIKEEKELFLHKFICENCFRIDFQSFCRQCKRYKRIAYRCPECGIININNFCIYCGKKISDLDKTKLSFHSIFSSENTDLDFSNIQICYRKINYIEPSFTIMKRIKRGLKVSENGACEIELEVVPCEKLVIEGKGIEIAPFDIILPINAKKEIDKITEYINEELEGLGININFDKNEYLLIRTSKGLIYYEVKVEGFHNINVALISPKLYRRLFPAGKKGKLKICLPIDLLLNGTGLLFQDEKIAYIVTIYEDDREDKEKFELLIKPEATKENISFKLKHQLLRNIAMNAKKEITTGLRCKKCDTFFPRITAFLGCRSCGSKLQYRWSRKGVSPFLKEVDEIIAQNKVYKRMIRKLKKPIYAYLKGEELSERLDKFFNI